MGTPLSEKQAFDAMYRFLEAYWKRFADARLSDVLGDIQPAFLADTVTADPAAFEDWHRAVEEVLGSRER